MYSSTAHALHLALCFSAIASLSSASAWPGWLPELDALVVRADSSSSSSSASNTGSAAPSPSPSPPPSSSFDSNTAGLKPSGKQSGSTGSGSTQPTQKGSQHTTPTPTHHKTFPIEDPAGGVNLQVPATIVTPTPLYMIGDHVTFSWNYTSLLAAPTAIDVLISCTVNQATWTLTSNMTFQTDVSYVWNSQVTNDDPDTPLLTDIYQMIVKDTNAEVTDTPEPGYLTAWSGLSFGMYANQKYVAYDEWTCPGSCSAAHSLVPTALGLLLPMAVITVLSFSWFVTGLGLS